MHSLLQEIAHGGQIMVSEETFKLVKGVEAEKLESLELPHLQERITAYLIE
jgi:class 3 adenylate cyclase